MYGVPTLTYEQQLMMVQQYYYHQHHNATATAAAAAAGAAPTLGAAATATGVHALYPQSAVPPPNFSFPLPPPPPLPVSRYIAPPAAAPSDSDSSMATTLHLMSGQYTAIERRGTTFFQPVYPTPPQPQAQPHLPPHLLVPHSLIQMVAPAGVATTPTSFATPKGNASGGGGSPLDHKHLHSPHATSTYTTATAISTAAPHIYSPVHRTYAHAATGTAASAPLNTSHPIRTSTTPAAPALAAQAIVAIPIPSSWLPTRVPQSQTRTNNSVHAKFRCPACDVQLSSLSQLEEHKAGARHRKRESELNLVTVGQPIPVSDLTTAAASAAVPTNSAAPAIRPSRGQSLAELKRQLPSIVEPITPLHPMAKLRPGLMSRHVDEHAMSTTVIGLYCKTCDTILSGALQLDDHILGKKHRKAIAKKKLANAVATAAAAAAAAGTTGVVLTPRQQKRAAAMAASATAAAASANTTASGSSADAIATGDTKQSADSDSKAVVATFVVPEVVTVTELRTVGTDPAAIALIVPTPKTRTKPPPPIIPCTICGITSSSVTASEQHLIGKRHIKMAARHAVLAPRTAAATAATAAAPIAVTAAPPTAAAAGVEPPYVPFPYRGVIASATSVETINGVPVQAPAQTTPVAVAATPSASSAAPSSAATSTPTPAVMAAAAPAAAAAVDSKAKPKMPTPPLQQLVRRPQVSLHGLNRSASTLRDFVESYFMFHGLNPSADFWRFFPTLVFVEAAIYGMDEQNEDSTTAALTTKRQRLNSSAAAAAQSPVASSSDSDSDSDDASSAAASVPVSARLLRLSKSHSGMFLLGATLESRQLLDAAVMQQLECGVKYWLLERQICQLLATPKSAAIGANNKRSADDSSSELTLELIDSAIRLKSFDYRLLNAIMYQLTAAASAADAKALEPPQATAAAPSTPPSADERAKHRSLHVEFLHVSEILIEIGDDLFDYEDDVCSNSFNVYRAFIRLYGGERAPVELAAYIAKLETQYAALEASNLDAALRTAYRERCARAMREPGAGGRWTIPQPITDEAAYRRSVLTTPPAATSTTK